MSITQRKRPWLWHMASVASQWHSSSTSSRCLKSTELCSSTIAVGGLIHACRKAGQPSRQQMQRHGSQTGLPRQWKILTCHQSFISQRTPKATTCCPSTPACGLNGSRDSLWCLQLIWRPMTRTITILTQCDIQKTFRYSLPHEDTSIRFLNGRIFPVKNVIILLQSLCQNSSIKDSSEMRQRKWWATYKDSL